MAAAVRCMGRALIHHQRHSLSKMVYQTSVCSCSVNIQVPNRHFAAATKSAKKTKNVAKEKTPDEKKNEIEKIKAYPYMEGEPEDDVYLKRLYPRQIYDVEKAVHLLKKFQVLDFTGPKQSVYLDLTLDMTQGRKKNVAPFTSVLSLPYPFASEINKVAVFTENASEVKIAEENGAAFAGGTSLIQKIWDDEIVVDFYVAVPEIMPELNRLRKKLGKRFPRVSRNSIGRDIPKMLEFFKNGHEIKVDEERENFLQTKIARLDMSSDQIAANLQAVINEVCRHRPLNLGPFVIRAFLRSSTSEGLLLKIDPLLPKEVKNEESKKDI
ncbi:39S ribosomal protein L1, mitochondrial [Macaca thibetana thibetana]|uniref:39S ribosomal protein L1, mitochondrial n=1 Tax=Macaca thibetana thibetana TaxID=257877 RepID=UPI0021BC4B6D|nr:39S ribosomal protein L1, mitochondrial [Macaca thibetana thibetana]